MTGTVRILQLSDTHFLDDGIEAEGGGAYNTSEAFDAVFDHVGNHDHLDMVVVTGDVADHGKRRRVPQGRRRILPIPGAGQCVPGQPRLRRGIHRRHSSHWCQHVPRDRSGVVGLSLRRLQRRQDAPTEKRPAY